MNFKIERARWLELLTGDDRNSIRVQLCALSWDLAAFETIGEAIRSAPRNQDGSAEFPPLVFNLIRIGFYANFFISLRRITDANPRTVSLVSILKKMQANAACLTRSEILSAENIPYDYSCARKKQDEMLRAEIAYSTGGLCIPPELDWERFEERHATLDRLMGVTRATRDPSNAIPKAVFSRLLGKVNRVVREAKDYTNKFVAHAELPGPKRLKVEQLQITHGKLVECCKCLGQVFNFMRSEILGAGGGPLLPFPVGDHLAYLDRPIASAETMSKLREKWDKMLDASWTESAWSIDDYESEFCSQQ
jgi:hypothetical protein